MSFLLNPYAFSPPYVQELQDVISFANANAITKPSDQVLTAYNTFLTGLSNAGLLTRMKTGNIYGFGSFDFGTINLKNPNTYRQTAQGTTPTYTEGQGVKSAGAGSCINTQYAVNEYAGIESDLTTIIDINEGGSTATTQRVYGAVVTTNAAQRLQLNTSAYFDYVGSATNFTNTDSRGLYVITYNGTHNVIYKDGGKFVTVKTQVTPTSTNKVLLLASNSNTANGLTVDGSFTRNVMCLFRFDRFTDADETNFRTLWEAFKTSVAKSSAVYYVRPAGSSYGTGTGTSYANAWAGFSSIVWASLLPGSTIYICGTHLETITIGANGVTFRGDYDGDLGVIDGQATRARCIYNNGYSYNILRDITVQNPTTDGVGVYDNSQGIQLINVTSTGSGNQAFQNEDGTANGFVGSLTVTMTNCKGSGCADDGLSLHGNARVTTFNCEFNGNSQGVNAINTATWIGNNDNIHDNTTNIQPDSSADFTLNGGTVTNGPIVGNSLVALKLNGVTRTNANTSGNVIIT